MSVSSQHESQKALMDDKNQNQNCMVSNMDIAIPDKEDMLPVKCGAEFPIFSTFSNE